MYKYSVVLLHVDSFHLLFFGALFYIRVHTAASFWALCSSFYCTDIQDLTSLLLMDMEALVTFCIINIAVVTVCVYLSYCMSGYSKIPTLALLSQRDVHFNY